MNEDDLRDCFAMFALIAATKDGSYIAGVKAMAITAYELADEMMEARKPKEKEDEETDSGGIASVAKRSYKRKR